MPHLGVDPVLIASHLILAFQSLVSRETKPIDATVLSVTQVHAGEATNVIPDHCVMKARYGLSRCRRLTPLRPECAGFAASCPVPSRRRPIFSSTATIPPPSTIAMRQCLRPMLLLTSWGRRWCSEMWNRRWAQRILRTCSWKSPALHLSWQW